MRFAFVQPKWLAHCTLDGITYSIPIAFRMGWTFGFSTNYVHHNQYLMDDKRPETASMILSVSTNPSEVSS
jgi:hypothetical protein